jgi:hypothetical protein
MRPQASLCRKSRSAKPKSLDRSSHFITPRACSMPAATLASQCGTSAFRPIAANSREPCRPRPRALSLPSPSNPDSSYTPSVKATMPLFPSTLKSQSIGSMRNPMYLLPRCVGHLHHGRHQKLPSHRHAHPRDPHRKNQTLRTRLHG